MLSVNPLTPALEFYAEGVRGVLYSGSSKAPLPTIDTIPACAGDGCPSSFILDPSPRILSTPERVSRFEKIKTLPGLPNEDTARELLEELAADPGVRAVLDKHRWTVGALCELYPEGQVPICLPCLRMLVC